MGLVVGRSRHQVRAAPSHDPGGTHKDASGARSALAWPHNWPTLGKNRLFCCAPLAGPFSGVGAHHTADGGANAIDRASMPSIEDDVVGATGYARGWELEMRRRAPQKTPLPSAHDPRRKRPGPTNPQPSTLNRAMIDNGIRERRTSKPHPPAPARHQSKNARVEPSPLRITSELVVALLSRRLARLWSDTRGGAGQGRAGQGSESASLNPAR